MTKTWFITGSSRGLGKAIAEQALKAGANVVATARRVETLDGLVQQYGDKVYPLALDVTDAQEAAGAIKAAKEHFGSLDVLVNNAGYGNMAAIEETTLSDFKAQMDTDFYGTLYTIKAALPIMRGQKAGRIINISSIGGRVGSAGLGAYQSAKFAVDGLTEVLDREVTPFNIFATAVEPGGMRTEWGSKSMAAKEDGTYAETVGKAITMIHDGWDEYSNRYISDPAKVGAALVKLSEMPMPPVHLLLGKDSQQSAKAHAEALAASDAKYAALTESTGETRN